MEEKSISLWVERRGPSHFQMKSCQIASNAAAARWNIPKATHEGTLRIGTTKIQCAVLQDGTRLLTQSGFLLAIGRSRTPERPNGSHCRQSAHFFSLNES